MNPMPHLGIPHAAGMRWLAEPADNPPPVLRLWGLPGAALLDALAVAR
ncbi:hypothetical protein [Streptomyces sp. NRRL F-5630]